MNAGETFHAASHSGRRKHLWVAITGTDSNGNLVIANVTSQTPIKDQSCILDIGDHPFIKKGSIVNYAEACITSAAAIRAAARGKAIEYDAAISAEALSRVQAGALASNQIELRVKAFVKAALGVP